MVSATQAGLTTTYSLNALGQRVKKSNSILTTYFVYDEQGHLLGEYDGSGNLVQEIVWLGDTPVASLRYDETGANVGLFYIHTDHLNTPRKMTRPSDNAIVWRWDSDPFGTSAPNEDPDGNSLAVRQNLRFPGQYYDAETGLNYNYFRDYDPAIGRYVQSDPVGLQAGTNTYSYAGANPISFVDPNGLDHMNRDRERRSRDRPSHPERLTPRPQPQPTPAQPPTRPDSSPMDPPAKRYNPESGQCYSTCMQEQLPLCSSATGLCALGCAATTHSAVCTVGCTTCGLITCQSFAETQCKSVCRK